MLGFKVAVLHFKLSKEYRDDLLETDSWPWQKQLSNDIVNLRHQNCAFFVFLTEHFLFPLSQLYDDLSDMLSSKQFLLYWAISGVKEEEKCMLTC